MLIHSRLSPSHSPWTSLPSWKGTVLQRVRSHSSPTMMVNKHSSTDSENGEMGASLYHGIPISVSTFPRLFRAGDQAMQIDPRSPFVVSVSPACFLSCREVPCYQNVTSVCWRTSSSSVFPVCCPLQHSRSSLDCLADSDRSLLLNWLTLTLSDFFINFRSQHALISSDSLTTSHCRSHRLFLDPHWP